MTVVHSRTQSWFVRLGLALLFSVAGTGCRDAKPEVPDFATRLPGHTVCAYWAKSGLEHGARIQQLRQWMLELGFHETTVPDSAGQALAFLADAKVEVGFATLAESTTFQEALTHLDGRQEECLFVDLSLWLDSTLSKDPARGTEGPRIVQTQNLTKSVVTALGIAELRGLMLSLRTVDGSTVTEGVVLGSGSGFGPFDLLRGSAGPLLLPVAEPLAAGQVALRVDGEEAKQIVHRVLTMTEAGGGMLERLAAGGQRLLAASIADPLPDLSGLLHVRYLDANDVTMTLVPNDPEKARLAIEERWPALLRNQLVDQLGLRFDDGRIWLRWPARGPFPRSTTYETSNRQPLEQGLLWASFQLPGSTMSERAEVGLREGGPRFLRIELVLP